MRLISLTILITLELSIYSQETYTWLGIACEYESIYDNKIYSRQEIQNCYELSVTFNFHLNNTVSVFDIEDLENLSISELDKDYEQKITRLKKMRLPQSNEWELLRTQKINELNLLYKLNQIEYNAFMEDLTALKSFITEDSCMEHYRLCLENGGEYLLNCWYSYTNERASKNGFPEKVWKTYYSELVSEDKFLHAKIDLLTFGWGNCANRHIERMNQDDARDLFESLFISTNTVECDEP